MMPSSTPMVMVPTPSQFGSSVISEMAMALKAMTRPSEGAEVLEQHHGQLRGLRPPDELRPACSTPFTCRDSTMAVRSEKLSSTIATPRMA